MAINEWPLMSTLNAPHQLFFQRVFESSKRQREMATPKHSIQKQAKILWGPLG